MKDKATESTEHTEEEKYLIEIKDIVPVIYYAGYQVKDREISCFEEAIHLFTCNVHHAKQYPSKSLAYGILEKLPMQSICVVRGHMFIDSEKEGVK